MEKCLESDELCEEVFPSCHPNPWSSPSLSGPPSSASSSLVAEKKEQNRLNKERRSKDLLVHPHRRVATPLGPESLHCLRDPSSTGGELELSWRPIEPQESLHCLRDLASPIQQVKLNNVNGGVENMAIPVASVQSMWN